MEGWWIREKFQRPKRTCLLLQGDFTQKLLVEIRCFITKKNCIRATEYQIATNKTCKVKSTKTSRLPLRKAAHLQVRKNMTAAKIPPLMSAMQNPIFVLAGPGRA
jgi:hypothetical protein